MKCLYLKGLQAFLWTVLILPGVAYPAAADRPLTIYVVNYPLKYFAERIGGPHVEVTLPVPAGEDPVYWTPAIADITAYQQADLILLNGAGYAKWVSKVSLPRGKIVDTAQAFKDRFITVKEIMTHSHGAEGEHAHEGLAFTTWLDLSLAAEQANAVTEALARKCPQQKELFRNNFYSLEKELLAIDDQLRSTVSPANNRPVVFSHPVYEYLENRYRLNGRSIHWEPDQDPSPEQVGELKKVLDAHPAQWMIWEGEPNMSTVDALRTLGIESTVFNPCGNIPQKGDFLSVMQQNVTNLERVFR